VNWTCQASYIEGQLKLKVEGGGGGNPCTKGARVPFSRWGSKPQAAIGI